jgi:hypothetical protein
MNKSENYTPVGFKTKAVKEQMAQATPTHSVSDKVKMVTQMAQLGNVIISPQFQQYTTPQRVAMLNQFAELQEKVNSFK